MRHLVLYTLFWVSILVPSAKTVKRHRHHRRTQINDEQIWGRVGDPNDNRLRATTEESYTSARTTTTTERQKTDDEIRASLDVCQPYEPNMPDYTKPGRRVSKVKCLEVMWGIKRRVDEQNRERNCYWAVQAAKGWFGGDEIGGRNAYDGEFPHMGAVGWKATEGTWIFKCGATLISDKFVMTAGHCTKVSDRDKSVSDPEPKIVRLGDNNILDPGVTRRNPVDGVIVRIIKHPAYRPPQVYNDIALMELSEPVQFHSKVHPACLWGAFNTSKLGNQATSTGWGVVETVKYTTSPLLKRTVLDLVDNEQCGSLMKSHYNRKFSGLKRNQLCAGKLEGGTDSCQGDSGGPLQIKIKLPRDFEIMESMYYVIGVTSFGIGCAKANTPGVYARVSSYIDWIEQTVWGSHGVARGRLNNSDIVTQ